MATVPGADERGVGSVHHSQRRCALPMKPACLHGLHKGADRQQGAVGQEAAGEPRNSWHPGRTPFPRGSSSRP